jgi:hypothetical protein
VTTGAYYRACRKCGRRIQLRQMPHGQWVAFEGYDTPHACSSPPASARARSAADEPSSKKRKRRAANSRPRASAYEDLEFLDFGVPPGDSAEASEQDAVDRAEMERLRAENAALRNRVIQQANQPNPTVVGHGGRWRSAWARLSSFVRATDRRRWQSALTWIALLGAAALYGYFSTRHGRGR